MHVFFDSSALAKRYIKEKGSEQVNEIFAKATTIFVSIICLPEIFSALNRFQREQKINHDQYTQIKESLRHDFKDFSVCDLTPVVIEKSILILERFPLRTMDALHVACAMQVETELFVTGDKKQTMASQKSHLKTLFI